MRDHVTEGRGGCLCFMKVSSAFLSSVFLLLKRFVSHCISLMQRKCCSANRRINDSCVTLLVNATEMLQCKQTFKFVFHCID